jgi:tetratricopeptide (TPR) repeat protein
MARRRRWPWWFGAGGVLLVLSLCGWWWQHTGPKTADGPIILISIDTLRADHLPAYGYRGVRTPAIDALAADGTVFERAYAHSPLTLPSHTAILSGRLPFENGVRDNAGFTLGPGLVLLPQMLHDQGFATGGVVSSFILRADTGINRGFDFFDSRMPAAAAGTPAVQIERSGEASLAAATTWLNTLNSPKFFLFFHLYEPHTPYAPPERFKQYAPYDGEVAWADESVAGLVAWLRTRGWYDKATIILLADHGEGLGDHGELEHGLFLYDETIRVPLIIKLPGRAGAGRRTAVPVQHIDLVPTVLDWIGTKPQAGLRGRSLRGLLDGSRTTPAETGFYAEALYSRFHYGWSELYALTDARYRFIKAPRAELYDLEQDPGQKRNVLAERPQPAAAMRAALDGMLAGTSVPAPGAVSAEDRQRLAALGYVGTQAAIPSNVSADALPDPKDKIGVLETLRRAAALTAAREFDQAIPALVALAADNPDMKDVWVELSILYQRTGRLPEALSALQRLVTLDPQDGNSLISAAQVLAAMNRFDEAEAHANSALALLRTAEGRVQVPAYEVLVKVALARHDNDGARKAAGAAQAADPALPLRPFVDGVILHGAGRYGEALPLFQETIRKLQGHTTIIEDLFFYTGDTLGRLGEVRPAIDAFRTEISLSPDNLRAYSSLAILCRADGQNAEAEATMAKMVHAMPTPDAYATAIRLWIIFGEGPRAGEMRRDAVRRFGEDTVRRAERAVMPATR